LIDFDAYSFRSCMGLDTTLSCDARRKDLDWDLLRKLTSQWQELAPNFAGDYYPLTMYSLENDVWMAWQFDLPEKGQGMVQAFRRPKCNYESARFALNGLEPDAVYVVTDVDKNTPKEVSGRELTENGLLIVLPSAPSSAIVTYNKKKQVSTGGLSFLNRRFRKLKPSTDAISTISPRIASERSVSTRCQDR
jgi:alpha-galactosidase